MLATICFSAPCYGFIGKNYENFSVIVYFSFGLLVDVLYLFEMAKIEE